MTVVLARRVSGSVTPFPYVAFYRIRRDDVVIQRIRHTSRKPI